MQDGGRNEDMTFYNKQAVAYRYEKKVCDNQRREGKLMEVIREQEDEEEDEKARESAMNL
jgi:hypothetical protein